METQIAIETSRIIKASTEIDGKQSLAMLADSSSRKYSRRQRICAREVKH